MSFSIVETTVKSFTDPQSNIKLPRFQRKKTWDNKQNFELCISVFKQYPVGVVIVNENQNASWLLDGRQRRNALALMHTNPVAVYDWATSFIKIKNNFTEQDIRDAFWKRIDIYFQKEYANSLANSNSGGNSKDSIEYEELMEIEDKEALIDRNEGLEDSFDPELQHQSLKTLLDLILMVHPRKKGTTNFEKIFLFNKIIEPRNLKYTELVDGNYKVNPARLKKAILDALSENREINDELIIDFCLKKEPSDNVMNKLKTYIVQNIDMYQKCFDVIQRTEHVISQARIGMIKINNASVLDTQNIFTLVNKNGTPLTSEELLSARPFWNEKINGASGEVKDKVKELYKSLDVDIPDDVYRWDYGATFLSRIDKNHLVFPEITETQLNKQMALGFKLLSAIFVGGITNNDVMNLEKANIDWETDIDKLVADLNTIINVISQADYFKAFAQWEQSICDITSRAIAQEFITILYKRWEELDEPSNANGSKGKMLCKDAIILLDKLIYQYTNGLWKGSSDSRLSKDLKNIQNQLVPVTNEEWKNLINSMSGGTLNGSPTKPDNLKAVIYHYYSIKKYHVTYKDTDIIYDIDHIVAQNLFDSAPAECVNKELKNSLGNLAPLPKPTNQSKSGKPLNKIDDEWIKKQVKDIADLNDAEIEKYSDIRNVEDLIKKRIGLYVDVYTNQRMSLLAN